MLNYHTSSIKASLTTSSQISYLTISIIDELKGVDEDFIIHWNEKLRACEATIPRTDKWSDSMEKIMLEHDAAPLPQLKNVKCMDEQLKLIVGALFLMTIISGC